MLAGPGGRSRAKVRAGEVGPGVQAGFFAARAAGQHDVVESLDIVELCPPLDPDGRTARIAARLIGEFLHGLAQRGPKVVFTGETC